MGVRGVRPCFGQQVAQPVDPISIGGLWQDTCHLLPQPPPPRRRMTVNSPRLSPGATPPASPRAEDAGRNASPGARERLARPEPLAARAAPPDAETARPPPRGLPPPRDLSPRPDARAARPGPGEVRINIDPVAPLPVPAVRAHNAQPAAAVGPGRRALGLLATGLTGISYLGGIAAGTAIGLAPNDPAPQRAAVAALLLRMFALGLQMLAEQGGPDRQDPVGPLRHPELRDLLLDQVVKNFCAPESPASRFNWAAEDLFTDNEKNMTAEVSHLLARAFAENLRAAGDGPHRYKRALAHLSIRDVWKQTRQVL